MIAQHFTMVKYGLIGVAGIGEGMIKNLLATGVDVWSHSLSRFVQDEGSERASDAQRQEAARL